MFSDLVIFTNGMAETLVGKRNVIVSVLVGVLLIVWYRLKDRIKVHEFIVPRIPYVIVLLSALVYTSNKIQFCVLSVVIFALSFLYDIYKDADKLQRQKNGNALYDGIDSNFIPDRNGF